jgi:hypothetical protein
VNPAVNRAANKAVSLLLTVPAGYLEVKCPEDNPAACPAVQIQTAHPMVKLQYPPGTLNRAAPKAEKALNQGVVQARLADKALARMDGKHLTRYPARQAAQTVKVARPAVVRLAHLAKKTAEHLVAMMN